MNLREIWVIHHEVFLEERLVREGLAAGGAVRGAVCGGAPSLLRLIVVSATVCMRVCV